MSQIFDLKGSLLKRFVSEEEQARGETVLKDLNFCRHHHGTDNKGRAVVKCGTKCRKLRVGRERWPSLIATLMSDVEFLRNHNIMDYSLLVGIAVAPVDRSASSSSSSSFSSPPATTSSSSSSSSPSSSFLSSSLELGKDAEAKGGDRGEEGTEEHTMANGKEQKADGDNGEDNDDDADEATTTAKWSPTSPAYYSEWVGELGGMRARDERELPKGLVYSIGIIDILQEFNMTKRLESAYKTRLQVYTVRH
jgi:1-phosphatidylinositol-4-phosphate 5-kinase